MNINLTLVGQMLTFVLFVWFTVKYVWTPITDALDERRKGIADSLAAAERGAHEKELAEQRATEVLHDAKTQAAEIIAQGQKRGAEIVDEAKEDARVEGDRLLVAAKAEVEQERHKAREELRKQVAALAVAGAEKILKKEINASAHKGILDTLAKQI